MENTVQLKNEDMLQFKFDLKGSTYKRKTKGVVTSKIDRKDLDFLEIKKSKQADQIRIARINQHLTQIICRDVCFL